MLDLTNYNRLLSSLGVQSTYLIMLQQLYGFRVGELLRLRRSNLNSEGFLYVKGSKRSSSRIVRVPELLSEPYFANKMPKDLLFTISYNQYYRIVSRLNVHRSVRPGKRNNKVTHAFRHLRTHINENFAGDDLSAVQNFSGHKSKRGLSHYLVNHKLDRHGKFVPVGDHNK